MKRILAAALLATLFFPKVIEADEIAIDGVVWLYDVSDGAATVLSVKPATREESDEPEEDWASVLETLKIPDELGGVAVMAIGDGAFAEMDALREIRVPSGVTRIGSRAFKDCRALKSVKLSETVTEIKDRAFSGCRSLTNINLGSDITNIAERTFRDCRALASVDLPENLAGIGEKAFSDCSSLRSITIPRGVTNIAAWAFVDCTSLATVVFLGREPAVGEEAFARVDPKCFFRASSDAGWGVEIPGVWHGRKIVDLTIGTYRRKILIFLPMIVGAIGTLAILVLAIVLRERRNDDDED